MSLQVIQTVLPPDIEHVSGTVNGVITTWVKEDTHVWATVADRSEDDLYNISLLVINAMGSEYRFNFTILYGMNLVTDRTGGYYNISDLNRVGAAVNYLKNRLDSLPQELSDYLDSLGVAQDVFFQVPYQYPVDVEGRTNWVVEDVPTTSEMLEYLRNVVVLKETLELPPDTPEVPITMSMLKYQDANDIEKVLLIVNNTMELLEAQTKLYADNTAATFVYSGEIYSGEV